MMQAVIACMLLLWSGVFALIFTLQRRAYRSRQRARLDPGFYPATRDLGNALHSLQTFIRPEIAHVMHVKQSQPKEEEDGGGDNNDPHAS